jgi:predicted nucleic acid-binding protein
MEWGHRGQEMEGEKVLRYIIDTSVVVKWFSEHNEGDLDKALYLRNEVLENRCSITVPALMFYELTNALRYHPRFNHNDVKDAVRSVMEMGFDIRGIDINVVTRAIEVGFKHNITVYDAYFLALSQIEKIPLITADKKFIRRIKGIKNILSLAEI